MEPLQSWLDAKAVRRMAEDLMAPAPEVDEPTVDAGYGDAFEGFAASHSESRERADQPSQADHAAQQQGSQELRHHHPAASSEPEQPATSSHATSSHATSSHATSSHATSSRHQQPRHQQPRHQQPRHQQPRHQ